MSRILVVEDETIIRSELRRLLARHGHEVAEAGSVRQAEAEHELASFDLILTDLRLPGAPGTDLIAKSGGVPVLVLTSYATVRSAVEAMRQGAVDYLAKPFDHDELVMQVERVLRQGRLVRQNQALQQDVERHYGVEGMVGRCKAMQDAFERGPGARRERHRQGAGGARAARPVAPT
jgi:DNA-binding NtrC family response regulator